jgi:DNA-binding NtrC family response regulator
MVFLLDDKADVLIALEMLLKANGIPSRAFEQPADALQALERDGCALLISDMNFTRSTTEGSEGLALIERAHKIDPALSIVVMTAWGSVDLAVRAIKAGAVDFIEKPFDNARVLNVVRTQLKLVEAALRAQRLAAAQRLDAPDPAAFIARSAAMQPVLKLIDRTAPTDANVLILGENGTGKGIVAGLIHAASKRAAAPMVKVNMGGLAVSVFESEMFGHVKGAYTDAKADRVGRFELADGGTLFLDEIGNLDLNLQPKLLRVLEDGELERLGSSRTIKVDVRLIAATNADLDAAAAAGHFRRDLLFRLNTLEIRLPPLRDRLDDIEPLAQRYLTSAAQRYGKGTLRFSPSASSALRSYAWPGNVRELSHVCERAALLASSDQISANDLSFSTRPLALAQHETLEQTEERLVRAALAASEGNVQLAAERLGLSRAALYRRLEKFGLRANDAL